MKSINARVRNVSLLAVLSLMAATAFATPEVGEPAPEFKMQDQNGDWRSLSDYRGKWVALYFYPKDDTPGCTTQACAFRDNIFAFRKIDAEIVGISLDDVETHQEFAEKYSLPFTLLSDKDGETAKRYGVLKNYGVMKLASRQSFLIDPDAGRYRELQKVAPATGVRRAVACRSRPTSAPSFRVRGR
jgi:peroxiredoxin Q/BCP